jgi:DNA-binding transcriptional MerR regulator
VPTDAPYSISDLARLTGVSVRTIRYYLAQGLIPASGESGPGAHYGDGHLGRLRLVRRLQQQHLPLAEIRARLASLSDADVAHLIADDAAPAAPEPQTSALEYVRSVLSGSAGTMPAPQPVAALPPAALPPAAMPPMRDQPVAGQPLRRSSLLKRADLPFVARLRESTAEPAMPLATAALPAAFDAATPSDEPAPRPIERSQWERLSLGPNLELHVRRPLSRLEQKRVERLITIARQVLKEEQP